MHHWKYYAWLYWRLIYIHFTWHIWVIWWRFQVEIFVLELMISIKKVIKYELQWVILTSIMMVKWYTTLMGKHKAFQLEHQTIQNLDPLTAQHLVLLILPKLENNLVVRKLVYFYVWISIYVSNLWLSGRFTVSVKCNIKLLSVSLIPSTNSLLWPGALIPRLVIILNSCEKIGNKYNYVAHM